MITESELSVLRQKHESLTKAVIEALDLTRKGAREASVSLPLTVAPLWSQKWQEVMTTLNEALQAFGATENN